MSGENEEFYKLKAELPGGKTYNFDVYLVAQCLLCIKLIRNDAATPRQGRSHREYRLGVRLHSAIQKP